MYTFGKSNIFGGDDPSLSGQEVLRDFVKAISKAGFSKRVILKGGMNLEVALDKYKSPINSRITLDADLHVKYVEDWETLLKEIPNSITNCSDKGIKYQIKKRRGLNLISTSDSVDIVTDKGVVFSVDMNVNPHDVATEQYVEDYPPGYAIPTMLADKLKVYFSQRIYRRTKDLYDLFLLSQLEHKVSEIRKPITDKWNSGEPPRLPLHYGDPDKLRHAYNLMERIPNKPDFEVVYSRVCDFAIPLMTFLLENSGDESKWNPLRGEWTV